MILILETDKGRIYPYLDGKRLQGILGIDVSVMNHMITDDRDNGIYVFDGDFEIRDSWIYAK